MEFVFEHYCGDTETMNHRCIGDNSYWWPKDSQTSEQTDFDPLPDGWTEVGYIEE